MEKHILETETYRITNLKNKFVYYPIISIINRMLVFKTFISEKYKFLKNKRLLKSKKSYKNLQLLSSYLRLPELGYVIEEHNKSTASGHPAIYLSPDVF